MAQEDFIPLEVTEGSSSKPRVRKDRVNTTVFISSLPYAATTTDLLTHFSYIGPVRHGFIATDKESGKSKGVGYVTYSLKEDADRAVTELDGGEFGGKGRKIRVTWADKRPAPGETVEHEVTKTKKPKRTRTEIEPIVDPNAIRSLVLSGLPAELTKAVLWKKVRKIDDRVELLYPVEGEVNTAHLVFPAHSDALQALPKLHGHIYKSSLLSCVLKKRLDTLAKSPSHAGRLIVRNLSWNTAEQDLRATFLPFGPIHSIDLPTLPSKLPSALPRARGFAFVWFLARKDAEKAMESVNGKVIKKAGGKAKREAEGRPVAVDWALSKEKWQETQKVERVDGEGVSGSRSSASSSEEDSEGSDDSSSGDDEAEYDEDEVDGDDAMEEDEPVKPQLPTVDVGSTLFIRNLPFETTQQELNTLFRSFGPLRYARITIDKSTGRSRGSGFVCFWNTSHADVAMAEAERVSQETGANAMPLGGKNPFALPSVLTADPSSSITSKLVLHGRTLDVTRAVTREEAGQMREDGERARTAGDKRNTYLMREGVIFPNSPAAGSLPEAEVEKRQTSFNARKALLRSNPSLYISKTRLSIRQLPLFVTDRTLKRLAIHAVRTFDDEVKVSDREALSRAEDTDETVSPALAGKKKKRGERETPVVQSKIVRQAEKVDPLTGMGRSRGYGFLEMRSHKDALKVLRWANNNPEVGGLMWSWWRGEMGELLERTKTTFKAAEERKAGKGDAGVGDAGRGGPDGIAKEKETASVEELEQRIKRLEARVAEGDDRSAGGMRGGKTLMIEFSIENVQVVKRRVEKISASRDTLMPVKRKASEMVDTDEKPMQGKKMRKDGPIRNGAEKGDRRGGKVGSNGKEKSDQRREKRDKGQKGEPNTKPEPMKETATRKVEGEREKVGLEKLGAKMGSMIGRKRKMRRGGN